MWGRGRASSVPHTPSAIEDAPRAPQARRGRRPMARRCGSGARGGGVLRRDAVGCCGAARILRHITTPRTSQSTGPSVHDGAAGHMHDRWAHHLDHGSTVSSAPHEAWLSRSELFRRYRRLDRRGSAAASYQMGSRAPAATIAPLATPISASPATSPAANSTPLPRSVSSPPAIARDSAPSRIVTLRPNGR